MGAPIKGVIDRLDRSDSHDVVTLWFGNGMGFVVHGNLFRKVANDFSSDVFTVTGLVATFEQFDAEKAQREAPEGVWVDHELHGRWMLVSLDRPEEP